MNIKRTIGAVFLAVVIGNAFASDEEEGGFAWAPGDGISFNETPIMSTEASLNVHSKYMSYGVVYGNDPIVVPGVTATFFDWVYIGVESIFDMTKGNGKGFEYGNRAGKYTTIDAFVGLAHEFDLGETIGTLSVDFGYMYEYFTRNTQNADLDDPGIWDSQYLMLEMSLDGHWLVPTIYVERDLMYDNGTYASLTLGHEFEIYDGITLTPSIGQGLGNTLRTKGYFADLGKYEDKGFSHGGLMDTTIKLELEYEINDWLTLGAYVAYYDYLFDDKMREAAAAYNGQWGSREDKTWNFVGGLSLTVAF